MPFRCELCTASTSAERFFHLESTLIHVTLKMYIVYELIYIKGVNFAETYCMYSWGLGELKVGSSYNVNVDIKLAYLRNDYAFNDFLQEILCNLI